jgi:ATP-binding cassette subfamily B protein
MQKIIKPYWDLLAEYIQPQIWRFGTLVFLLCCSIGLQLINPQIMRKFIDAALAGAPLNQLILTGCLFLGIAIIQQVVSVSVTYLGEKVAWTATNALREDLAWHSLNLDMGYHNEHTPGELIERIDGDVGEMANFFSQFVILIFGNLLLIVGILVVLFLENWGVALVFTVYALISVIILAKVRDIAVPFQKKRRQAEAELFGFLEEQLNSTEDIRSSGAVGFSIRELFRLMTAIFKNDKKAQYKGWQIGVVMSGLLTIGNILALISGYFLYSKSIITIGTVYLFINYMNMIELPIWALTHQVQNFQTIGACVERLNELKAYQPKVNDGEGITFPQESLSLRYHSVSFAYKEDEPVLKNLSFNLPKGKILGLLGRTGSGKTTIARLLFRLYDPNEGKILIEGKDIRQSTLENLHHAIAMVTQEVQLFRASIRENLTFFNPSILDEQILVAINTMELGAWYQSLPEGLDTILETGGQSLSAGEAQLLAFTRVLLRNPGLVILDEASSRLDPATEQKIERAINRLLENRTAIVIAHRLGTIERANDILILENGLVSEYGDRKTLASDPNSQFHHLLQTGLEEMLV